MDLGNEPKDRARERERDRGRSHERQHHSSSTTDRKQRYYSCDRYGNREHCHSRSPGPSRSTSPGDPQDPNRFQTVLTKQCFFGSIFPHACLSVCLPISASDVCSLLYYISFCRVLTQPRVARWSSPQAPVPHAVEGDSSLRHRSPQGLQWPLSLPAPLYCRWLPHARPGQSPRTWAEGSQSMTPCSVSLTNRLLFLSLGSDLTPTSAPCSETPTCQRLKISTTLWAPTAQDVFQGQSLPLIRPVGQGHPCFSRVGVECLMGTTSLWELVHLWAPVPGFPQAIRIQRKMTGADEMVTNICLKCVFKKCRMSFIIFASR